MFLDQRTYAGIELDVANLCINYVFEFRTSFLFDNYDVSACQRRAYLLFTK